MAGLATQETNLSVSAFLDEIRNDDKRNDAKAIVELMHDVTGDEPKVWEIISSLVSENTPTHVKEVKKSWNGLK